MRREYLMYTTHVLLGILTIIAAFGIPNNLPPGIFWICYWSLLLFTIFVVLKAERKTLAILILSLTISFIYIGMVPAPWQEGRDEIFEADLADKIVQQGVWNPREGIGFAENYYGYTPVLHFLTAAGSLASGISPHIIVKYLMFPLIRLLLLLGVCVTVVILIGSARNQIVYTILLLFSVSVGVSFVGTTRRSIASLLFLLTIISILRLRYSDQRFFYHALFVVFSTLLLFSDRSISSYLLIFLVGFLIYTIIVEKFPIRRARAIMQRRFLPDLIWQTLFFGAIYVLYRLKYAGIFQNSDASYVRDSWQLILATLRMHPIPSDTWPMLKNFYSVPEMGVIYGSQIIFLLLGTAGLLIFIHQLFIKLAIFRKPFAHESMLIYLGLFGLATFVISALFMKTSMDTVVTILLWFFSLPIAIFAGVFFEWWLRKRIGIMYVVPLALVVLLLGTAAMHMGIFAPSVTAHPSRDILTPFDERAKSEEVLKSGAYLAKSMPGAHVLGDMSIYETYGGRYGLHVNPYYEYQQTIYLGTSEQILEMSSYEEFEFGMYKHTHRYAPVQFIITNTLVADYFNRVFGRTDAGKGMERFDRIYDNGQIAIHMRGE